MHTHISHIYIYIGIYIWTWKAHIITYACSLMRTHLSPWWMQIDCTWRILYPLIKYFHTVCLPYSHAQIVSSAPRSWYIYIRHINPYTLQIVCTWRVFHPHARHSFHGARARHHRVLPACQVRYMKRWNSSRYLSVKWCMHVCMMHIYMYDITDIWICEHVWNYFFLFYGLASVCKVYVCAYVDVCVCRRFICTIFVLLWTFCFLVEM